MTCSHDDCQLPPRWKPVLELRSKARATSRRLRFTQLGYCDLHKRTTSLSTFLSDEGFNKIAKTVREAGKERIDQRHTTLAWEPLTGADRRRLGHTQHHTATPDASDHDPELAF
jgi:hypothetical protein